MPNIFTPNMLNLMQISPSPLKNVMESEYIYAYVQLTRVSVDKYNNNEKSNNNNSDNILK
jgi:hypothetical protein